jgi:hypothetical protein
MLAFLSLSTIIDTQRPLSWAYLHFTFNHHHHTVTTFLCLPSSHFLIINMSRRHNKSSSGAGSLAGSPENPSTASRRIAGALEFSTMSTTPSFLGDVEAARRYTQDDPENLPAEHILARGLSVNSVIPTTSSFARRFQKANNASSRAEFNEIGYGVEGVVFEVAGTETVIKRAKGDSSQALHPEFSIHSKVIEAGLKHELSRIVQIPKLYALHSASSPGGAAWWAAEGSRFPQQYREPHNIMVLQRILPLPKSIRHALIQRFHQGSAIEQEQFLSRIEQKYCLVRPYLGERLKPDEKRAKFSLVNLGVYVHQLEGMSIDVGELAISMAEAVAVMHWEANIDAHDVEFVLGSQADSPDSKRLDFQNRHIKLFLLDFGQCKYVGRDEAGLRRRGLGILMNDPYYPRPSMRNAASDNYWLAFKTKYIEVSSRILAGQESKVQGMPQQLIEGIEQQVEKNMQAHEREMAKVMAA